MIFYIVFIILTSPYYALGMDLQLPPRSSNILKKINASEQDICKDIEELYKPYNDTNDIRTKNKNIAHKRITKYNLILRKIASLEEQKKYRIFLTEETIKANKNCVAQMLFLIDKKNTEYQTQRVKDNVKDNMNTTEKPSTKNQKVIASLKQQIKTLENSLKETTETKESLAKELRSKTINLEETKKRNVHRNATNNALTNLVTKKNMAIADLKKENTHLKNSLTRNRHIIILLTLVAIAETLCIIKIWVLPSKFINF